ncbi:Hypothetical protein Tpal_613 [Trichococcus palustris]|jgi:multiple sugar transport system substrate-binding protein|uniref:Bacterial extracellular solute-binding protein n=1 Tax=Trichococcus palustris TaxID=140314 RepID=A0A143YCA1_9LACT|nr:sugar ABC transporter substrate-binding protein [Trichococcus palustris]CZQ85290.1 Hypothetical protein Tpal_613 [Trichococcus palustris]SFK55495.1 carbohydrate ABC transporter substrate-binding protein, CUT1 family (TC 3.A.1.1.-) [Trichococcus palustris]
MLKKWQKLSLATVVASAFVLGACGNGGSSNTASGDVTITYEIWDKIQQPGMEAIASAFEEKNPGIDVKVEVTPWDQYWTKLEAGAKGGSMPDVFWMHSNEIAKYSTGGVLMDLTDTYANSKIASLDNFPTELVNLYSTKDALYGIPKDYDTIGMWYNKTLFDKAGLAYPDGTWTWDTLLENAQKLNDPANGVYGVLAPLNSQEGYYNFIFQNGGYVLSDDKTKSGFRLDETIDAVQWYADLSLKYGVSPTQSQFAENTNLSFFQSGRGAIGFFGSWMTGEMANNEYTAANVDVAPLPKGKQAATIFNGLANSVSASTKNKEASLKFVEFLGSEEAMRLQGENGAAIPAYKGTEETFIKAYSQFNMQVFVDQMKNAYIKPYSNETARWEDVEKNALMPVFDGQKSVKEVAPEIVAGVEGILANEK